LGNKEGNHRVNKMNVAKDLSTEKLKGWAVKLEGLERTRCVR